MPNLKQICVFLAVIAFSVCIGFIGLFSVYGLSQGYDVPSGLYHLLQPARQAVLDNPPVDDLPWQRISWIADIENLALDESSGLTASHLHADIFWSINDSGGKPILYAFDLDGMTVGEWSVATESNIDWESMDSFVLDGVSYIAIGDTGNNFRWRRQVSILVVKEPISLLPAVNPVSIEWQFNYRYPEGYRDSEALTVDVGANKIYVLSKRHYPPELFSLPLQPAKQPDEAVIVAEYIAELAGFPQPTVVEHELDGARYKHMPGGMDLAGDRLLISTYKHAYLFSLKDISTLPKRVRLPSTGQRESMSFGHNSESVAYFTKEREDGKGIADLFRVELDQPSYEKTPVVMTADE